MTKEELDARLSLWGSALGEHATREQEPRSLTGNSTLAGFGRPTGYQGVAEGRNGRSRRALMGEAAGTGGKMIPAAYVSPVPCTATRSAKAPDFDPRYTAEVERVQAAWLALGRFQPLHAEVLRVEYQVRGRSREERAALVGKTLRDTIAPRRYKDALHDARTWMHARLAA